MASILGRFLSSQEMQTSKRKHKTTYTFVINSLKNIREKREQDTTGSQKSSCRLEDTLIRKMLDSSWAKDWMKLSHKQVQHFLDCAGPQILNYENARSCDDFDPLSVLWQFMLDLPVCIIY